VDQFVTPVTEGYWSSERVRRILVTGFS